MNKTELKAAIFEIITEVEQIQSEFNSKVKAMQVEAQGKIEELIHKKDVLLIELDTEDNAQNDCAMIS